MTDIATDTERRPLRIVRLVAENLMRIEAVEIVPDSDGGLVIVSGRNGQGKTSVLNAIWLALGGGEASRAIAKPVREGAEGASVRLDLGDLRVVRTWKADGDSTLKVESADGTRKYGSPQKMLDALVGRLSFDPLAFANLGPREQVTTLLDLVGIDVDDLAAQRRSLFDERTVVGRELKQHEGQVAALPPAPSDVPDEEVSTADLLAEFREARRAHDDHEGAVRRHAEARRRVDVAREELAAAEAALTQTPEPDASALPDLAAVEDRIANADALNGQVRARRRRMEATAALTAARQTYDLFTEQIEELDAAKAKALQDADLPIDGLGFDDGGVTYNGVPFKQCSAAEQLRVSVAMAMALNPTVRVIRITDGSLLDSDNLRLIEDMAGERGFQVWIERVDESGDVGIVIEDGHVAPKKKGTKS